MLHPSSAHYLLAPHDLADHLREDHDFDVDEYSRFLPPVGWARQFLHRRGIDLNPDDQINQLTAWHETAHARDGDLAD